MVSNDIEASISLNDDDIDPSDAFDQLNVSDADRSSMAVDSSKTSTSAAASGANEPQSLKQQLPAFLIPPDSPKFPQVAAGRGRGRGRGLRQRLAAVGSTRRIASPKNKKAVSTTAEPNFDTDKAVTKTRKPNRLQKGKAPLHHVPKTVKPEHSQDLFTNLMHAKTEARKELDSINKKDVDAYVAGMREYHLRIEAIDMLINDMSPPMPPLDQRLESAGASPSTATPTITVPVSETPGNQLDPFQKTTATQQTANNGFPILPQVASTALASATTITFVPTAPPEPVDRFRENIITKDLIQAPRFQLPENKKMSSHTDLLLLIEHDSKLRQHVAHKLWDPVVEAWVLEQVLEDSTAH